MVDFAYAQAAPGAAGPGPLMTIFPFIIILVIMYLMVFRPQQKKQKEHKAMVEAIGVGSEIVTGGGVLGKVTALGEQFVTIEIADGVQIKVQRHSIGAVLPKDTIKHA